MDVVISLRNWTAGELFSTTGAWIEWKSPDYYSLSIPNTSGYENNCHKGMMYCYGWSNKWILLLEIILWLGWTFRPIRTSQVRLHSNRFQVFDVPNACLVEYVHPSSWCFHSGVPWQQSYSGYYSYYATKLVPFLFHIHRHCIPTPSNLELSKNTL